MEKLDFQTKQKKLKKHQDKFRNSFRYKKLIAEAVKTIIKNDKLVFSKDDIKTISNKVYKRQDLLVCGRVRSTLSQEVVKSDINKALIEFYSNAGLDKQEAIELLKLAKETAKEKKDVNNLLKIVEKYESAANLTHKQGVTARTTETIDYSKIGETGEPARKVTRSLEVSNQAEATGGDIESDNKTEINKSDSNSENTG